ncbi:MAG: tetratricopeptide repeat protein, partial [Anaerolineae bacterium]|nr:tetratricopeptide repeat protein [Anaerolineae bacterium]
GYLLQLTIGDKGSNLLAVFGAPVAHDDDETRAVAAALDLQALPGELAFITPQGAGISRGLAWAGACGGRLRCIYTVMGDEVNMAARLMGKAAPGQILVNQAVADATARRYRYRSLGAVPIKGRAAPLPVSEALGRQEGVARTLGTQFAGRLVGRDAVLVEMDGILAVAGQGQGLVLRVEGPAGVGKSHLVAAFATRAAAGGWQVFQGACQSITQGTAYTPWQQLFAALLALPAGAPAAVQVERMSRALLAVNPAWQPRLPLLAGLLGLPMTDTPETANLEPRLRQQALFALVAEVMQAWGRRQPLLLVLEDVHWLDEVSAELVVASARALAGVPALLLVVQRPAVDADRPILRALDRLPGYHDVALGDLSPRGVEALVADRLGGPLHPLLGSLVYARAQGNPFFTEELVDALREAGTIHSDTDGQWVLSQAALDALLDANCLVKEEGVWRMVDDPPLGAAALDIPDSVQGTVLARLDRLPEAHKLTLKVASVVGRTFSAAALADIHPAGSGRTALLAELSELAARDLVHVEAAALQETASEHEIAAPIPDTRYLFKHSTTQEVAYGTLLFAQRQALHAQVARWYEETYGGGVPVDALALDSPRAAHYPLLVHHWHHAEDRDRERLYAGLAGEQAVGQYANESAMRYLGRALELTPAGEVAARSRLLFGREQAADVLGWRDEQHRDLAALEGLGSDLGDEQLSRLCLRQANLAQVTGDYDCAVMTAARAAEHAAYAQDLMAETRAHHAWGRILWHRGEYAAAHGRLSHALLLARADDNRLEQARILYDLGSTCFSQTDFDRARGYIQDAQEMYGQICYRPGEYQCQVMFGLLAYQGGDYDAAEAHYRRALAACRAIGWRAMEAHVLIQLGNNAYDLGNYQAAGDWHRQAHTVARETSYRRVEAISLDTLGLIYYASDELDEALACTQQALHIQRDVGDRRGEAYTLSHLGLINAELRHPRAARDAFEAALAIRRELGQEAVPLDDLAGLARLALAAGDVDGALGRAEEILTWLDGHRPDGIEFPALVYLTCYRVLRAATGDGAGRLDQACRVLTDGYNLIQGRAAGIQDEGQRQRFLEQVRHNRELLAAWREMAGQC